MSQKAAIRRLRQAVIDPLYSLQKAKGRKNVKWVMLKSGQWAKAKA